MAVTEKVKAEFDASSASGYSRVLGGLGSVAGSVSRSMSGLLSGTNLLKVGLAGLVSGATAHGIGKVGAEFENVQTRLAGTLSALDFAPDFTSGLQQAKGVMDSLYAAAAKLPGETEDYIEVFTSALPVLNNVKGGLAGATAYANRYTAVMKSMGIDTGEAAMNLQRLLGQGQGMAESRSPAFRQLSNYMRTIPGYANLTTASFNKMSQSMRTELLDKTLAKMGPMVDHMQTSWDAVSGAMTSAGRLLFRQATSPLFESMKKSMGGVADLILDSQGHLTRFGETVAAVGQTISKHIGGALERVVAGLGSMGANISAVLMRLRDNPVISLMDKVLSRGASMVQGVMGAASGKPTTMGNAAAGAGLGGLVAGPLGAMIGATVGFDNVVKALDVFVTTLMNVVSALAPIGVVVGTALVDMISSLATGLNVLITAVSAFFSDLFGTGFAPLGKQLGMLADAFGQLVSGIVSIVGPLLSMLAPILIPVLQSFTLTILGVVTALGKLLAWIGDKLGLAAKVFGVGPTVQGERGIGGAAAKERGPLSDFIDKLANLKMPDYNAAIAGAGKNLKTPAVRAGAKVVQDFRGSRFSIQQDFAQNFDPDRIVVAFTKDLERAAEQRRQSSGFSPIFGVS